jgi:hypothetical protein
LAYQRFRFKWLKEGDVNTSYFHACVKARKRSNTIVALEKGAEWSEKPMEVRNKVV